MSEHIYLCALGYRTDSLIWPLFQELPHVSELAALFLHVYGLSRPLVRCPHGEATTLYECGQNRPKALKTLQSTSMLSLTATVSRIATVNTTPLGPLSAGGTSIWCEAEDEDPTRSTTDGNCVALYGRALGAEFGG